MKVPGRYGTNSWPSDYNRWRCAKGRGTLHLIAFWLYDSLISCSYLTGSLRPPQSPQIWYQNDCIAFGGTSVRAEIQKSGKFAIFGYVPGRPMT